MAVPNRREQAVQLRLGLSRSQIAEALGLAGGGEPLSTWLRGVPAPAWTRRPRAKDDLREIAAASLAFWSQMVEAPASQFETTTLEAHSPKTVRKNIGNDYHGCLVVYVRRSAGLCLQIEGW